MTPLRRSDYIYIYVCVCVLYFIIIYNVFCEYVWISIIVFVDAFLYDCIVRYLRKFQGVLRKLAALGTSFLSDLHTLWEPQGDHRAVKGGSRLLQVICRSTEAFYRHRSWQL